MPSRPAAQKAMAMVITEFEKRNPDIRVKMELVPINGLHEKILAAIAAKTLPDIIESVYTMPVQYGLMGAALDVSDVIEPVKNNIYEPILPVLGVGGKYYSIPIIILSDVMWYRKDWFDESGVKVPETWNELLVAAKALHKPPERYGVIFEFPAGSVDGGKHIWTLMVGNESSLFDSNGGLIINNPRNIEALEFMKEEYKYAPSGAPTMSTTDARVAFLQGKAAIIHRTSASMLYEIQRRHPELSSVIGAAKLPVKEKGMKSGCLQTLVPMFGSAGTKHPEEVKRFFRFFLSDDAMKIYSPNTVLGFLPPTKSVFDYYLNHENIKPFQEWLKPALEMLPGASLPGWLYSHESNRYAPEIEGRLILSKMVQYCIIQGWSGEKAIRWAEKEIKEIMKE
jgi:multiple sugar transport system substrate-binding protein